MVSQLFPGSEPGESITHQHFLHTRPPEDGQAEAVASRMEFLAHVVGNEDYYTGRRIQRALQTGAKDWVHFGKNEGGTQRFHRWVQAVLDTPDDQLNELFRNGIDSPV